MLTETFDINTEPMISPEAFYGVREKVCDICIITFSDVVVEAVRTKFACTRIADIGSVNGGRPIWLMTYKGKKIAFYMTMVSSSAAGSCLEEARCLTGAGSYIMFGSCGALDREITAGKIIVPTHAYRDEGLSYHYVPPADYITMKNAGKVSAWLEEMGIPYAEGRTWTTDAIYRETKGNMDKRKAEGCIAVEMECAGVQAVCDFRGLALYSYLISGDLLDCEEWDARILGDEEEKIHQLKNFYIALEMALKLPV